MVRLRKLAAVAAATSLGFGMVGVPAVSAFNGSASPNSSFNNFPPLTTVSVNGASQSGRQFSGRFEIQRFVAKHGKAYAVGTVTGTLGNRSVTRYGVMAPASLTGPTSGASRAHAAASCPVLHLVLGPITLNLLGLVVTLGGGQQMNQPIVLDITAVSGPGNLLGNLLCSVSNVLNPNGGTLPPLSIQQLISVLNGILGFLNGTGL